MDTKFTYKGVPVEKDGVVHHVQRVRSIEAPNGKHYRGVLDVDAQGNEFVYNQYPNTGVTPPARLAMNEATGFLLMNPDTGMLVMIHE